MNFPAGKVILRGSVPMGLEKVANNLINKGVHGYIIQTIRATFIEESVLLFRDGKIIGCYAECLSVKKKYKGKAALEFFANQLKGKGYFQLVELTKPQIDLVTAFDEKLLFPSEISLKDVLDLTPTIFYDKFSAEKKPADLFEAYGLTELK